MIVGAMLPASALAGHWRKVQVTASAYNSLPSQTSPRNPALAAWGATIKPGMHVIAVSRDLARRGLTDGARVKVPGLAGIYRVRDKMNRRWHKKIDIYMGHDVKAARKWGVKKVTIKWKPPEDG